MSRRFEHRGEDVSRPLNLSDGLFAIVLTLLVLDLRVPADPGSGLLPALVDLWPRLFSFLLTFLVTGHYWLAHHWDFEHIVGYDRGLLRLNLMFLLTLSLLPFSTALLGDGGPVARIVYALNMVLAGVALTAVWGYSVSHGLADPMITPMFRRYVTARHLVSPAVFLASMPVALVAPSVVRYVPIVIPLILQLIDRRRGPRPRDLDSRQDRLWLVLGYLPLVVFAAFSVWLVAAYRR